MPDKTNKYYCDNFEEFVEKLTQTFDDAVERFESIDTMPMMQCSINGVVSESGEILDMINKHLYYGQDFDDVKMKEECGDLFHHFIRLLHSLNISLDDIIECNVKKLRVRYPDLVFDKNMADRSKRNTEKEYKIMKELD